MGQAQVAEQGAQQPVESSEVIKGVPPSSSEVTLEGNEKEAVNERNQTESEQRANEIFAAQQSMKASAKRAADYAGWQTILVAIGTIVLIYTLYLMRRANMVATAAVDVHRKMFEAEYRPYVLFDNTMEFVDAHLDNTMLPNGEIVSGHYLKFELRLFNYGSGPCTILTIENGYSVLDYKDLVDGVDTNADQMNNPHLNPPKSRCGYINFFVSMDELERMKRGISRVVVSYKVIYSSLEDSPERFTFEGNTEVAFAGMRQHVQNGPILPDWNIGSLPNIEDQRRRYQERQAFFNHLEESG